MDHAEFAKMVLDRITNEILRGEVVEQGMALGLELQAQVFVDDSDGSRAIIIAVTPV